MRYWVSQKLLSGQVCANQIIADHSPNLPGVPFYLSFFYRREVAPPVYPIKRLYVNSKQELALRTGLFVSAAPLATAYAGFLAYGITSIPSPIAPWRLLFILEGFPSMVMAIVSYYRIPDSPADAGFLTPEQKKIARRRLLVVRDGDDEEVIMGEEEDRGVRWGQVWNAIKDVGNWVTAVGVARDFRLTGANITSDSLCTSSVTSLFRPYLYFCRPYLRSKSRLPPAL